MAATLPGNPTAAATIAMNNPSFYSVTLKNFAAPWTNRDQNAFVPLNDYMTLVMGMVRDGVPFNQILTANLLYTGPGSVSPAPSATSNAHYEALESLMRETSFNQSQLVQTTQTAVYGTPTEATAGAMTTRAAAEAFFIAGTNRAMFRFTLINHLCMDMEQVNDTSIAPDRIRQDVSRSPGGDSRVFMNSCIGCHAGMDPMAQAFAYYDFDETSNQLIYNPNEVHPKYFNNDATFADGFVTPDNHWHNHWRQGQNALLGWNPALPGEGIGAKSLGEELAGTQAFAQCQVKKVFKAVCLRDPVDANDRNQIGAMTNTFRGAYDLKQVFAESAGYCMGQ
ncbi:MAG TPA: hypothetical protein VNA66_03530 [Gammaproteobacteria bacterium]|nr:hypothetical protein [Gammaproteobacteria bacterium]